MVGWILEWEDMLSDWLAQIYEAPFPELSPVK